MRDKVIVIQHTGLYQGDAGTRPFTITHVFDADTPIGAVAELARLAEYGQSSYLTIAPREDHFKPKEQRDG